MVIFRKKSLEKDMENQLPINQILCEDCIDAIPKLPPNSIDLIVTSPPYFNANKKYQRGTGIHYTTDVGEPLYTVEDLFEVAYRVVKPDGFFCINLGFSYGETGILRPFYVIQRALRYNWFPCDIIMWEKDNPIPIHNRLTNAFEYVFVLAKHPQNEYPNAKNMDYVPNIIRSNINKPKDASFHSAVFPIDVPEFCITHFSKRGDIVLDPFMGSGTTALACLKLGRAYLGYDISTEYVQQAQDRILKSNFSPTLTKPPQKSTTIESFFKLK